MSFYLHHLKQKFFRLGTIIGVLLVAFSVAGCSAVRLGYYNAPSLAYWWLDRYFDFDTAQGTQMRADLEALQTWHRTEELPLLAEMLKNLQTAAPATVTPTQICTLMDYLQSRLLVTSDRFTPALVKLAPTLTPSQLEHINRELDKHNTKWREEWVDVGPDELTNRRVDLLVDRAESFYGRLDPAQRAQLRLQVTNSDFDQGLNHQESLRRQQDALLTLKAARSPNASPLTTRAAISAVVERAVAPPNPAYRTYVEKLKLQTCKSLADLHNGTTSRQRQKLVQTLQGYETDARALMRN
jgi:hypothetical protein